MATGQTASSFKTVLGIAEEPQPATGTPVAATAFIPARKLEVENKVVKLPDQSWRGSMVETVGMQNGPQSAGIAIEGDAFPATIPYFLAGMLGDIAYTGGTASGTPTTTTGALVAGTTTVIPVTSATGITPGTVLAIDTSTLLELVTVLSVVSLNVTITQPVAKSHAGSVTVQPVTAPFTDTIALLNSGSGQPTSYSITDSDSLSTRIYASTRWSDLTLTYDASKLLTYSATGLSWATQGTASAPTPSYDSLPPAPAWACQASYGGSTNATVQTAELSWKRSGCECIFTLQNSPNPYEVHVGPITLDTKLTVVAADETFLSDYLANTSKVLTLDLTTGASASLIDIKVQMSAHNIQSVKKSKGKSYIEFDTGGVAIGNTTDIGLSGGYSPCLVTCKNAAAPGSFA